MGKKSRSLNENKESKSMKIPDYVCLKEKYKCDKCIFNEEKRNKRHLYRFPHNLKYMFSNCNGEPNRRTQCKKRCWFFSDLFSLITAAVIVVVLIALFSHLKSLMLAIAYTIIFAVGLDIVCCIIEYVVDKIFEGIEKMRRKNYDKKVENIEAVNREKEREIERQKEKEKELYKDIDEAKKLFSSLSKDYLNKIKKNDKSGRFPELKKEVYKKYKELLENISSLLKIITLENFYLSEVRTLFQVYIPKLCEHITSYAQKVEKETETEEQIEQLAKLLESFNAKIIQVRENLNSSDSESLVYKMQALREVVSSTKYKEED